MSLVNISLNTQTPGHLRSSWLKRLPDSDNDSDEGGTSAKVPRYSWYVTLESESPQPTDEDDESVYSIQSKETEFVADTSDTSTDTWMSSSDSGDLSLHVEYEVASLSEGPNPFDDSSSSGGNDIVAMGVLAFCDSDLGLADDSNDSRSSVDSEIGTADYWTCAQCNTKNNNPLFRYCEKCYQIRKNLFPPRPKGRKRRGVIESSQASSESRLSIRSESNKQELTGMDSGLCSSQESKYSLTLDLNLDAITIPNSGTAPVSPSSSSFSSLSPRSTGNPVEVRSAETKPATETSETTIADGRTSSIGDRAEVEAENAAGSVSSRDESLACERQLLENKAPKYRDKVKEATNVADAQGESDNKLCITCTAAPKNGAFVHGAVTHICCCYRCAVKVWSKTKRCPICNRKVTNILKAFYT